MERHTKVSEICPRVYQRAPFTCFYRLLEFYVNSQRTPPVTYKNSLYKMTPTWQNANINIRAIRTSQKLTPHKITPHCGVIPKTPGSRREDPLRRGCGGVVTGLTSAIQRDKSPAYDRLGEPRAAACTAAYRLCIGRSILRPGEGDLGERAGGVSAGRRSQELQGYEVCM